MFDIEGESYIMTRAFPGATPFQKVIVNRYGSSPYIKTTALFGLSTMPSNVDGSNLYLRPDYVSSMEALINTYVINRGTDNILTRSSSSSTTNNITRIDLILDQPVLIPADLSDRKESGFLLMERGGNDNFTVTGITGINPADTTPTNFGTIVSVPSSAWGTTGQTIISVVMQKMEEDIDLRPSQYIGSQPIAGVFISLDALGLAPGTLIYGLSLMANGSTSATTFPPEVLEANGGLDFMAGGGFFTRAYLIKGNVWVDGNGNLTQDGPEEPSTSNGLWANLVDDDGQVISSINVLVSDGSYTLFIGKDRIIPGMDYSIVMTNEEHFEGEILTVGSTLLNSYQYTGTSFNGVDDPTNKTGIINIGNISGDVENANFGINHAPEADAKSFDVAHTAFSTTPLSGFPDLVGYHSIPLNSSELSAYPSGGSLTGTDQQDCPTYASCSDGATFKITSINPNTKIYYDFEDGAGPVEVIVTSGSVLIPNFNVDNMVVYGQHGTGTIDSPVGFTYSIADAAGFESPAVPYEITSDIILSYQVMSLTAQLQNNIPVITWNINTEMKEDNHYMLQHSIDQKVWADIHVINKKYPSNGTYNDYNAKMGNNYYRLAQTDGNNTRYSQVAHVHIDKYDKYVVHPNPADDLLYITGLEGNERLMVFDVFGRKMMESTTVSNCINVEKLPAGQYIIYIHSNEQQNVRIPFTIVK